MSHSNLHDAEDLPTSIPSAERRSAQELFAELWSQALVAVGEAEDEVRKVLERLSDALPLQPEDLQRFGRELVERLRSQRKDLETSLEESVRGAVGRLRLSTSSLTPLGATSLMEGVQAVRAHLERLEGRLAQIEQHRQARRTAARAVKA